MIRVLLINPKAKFKFIDFPLALHYLKSSLDNLDIDINVRIIDLNVFNENFERYVNDFKPDFIGITATLPLANSAISLAKIIKRIIPSSNLIAGGSQPTLTPEVFLKDFNIVVRNEGELTLCDIVKKMPLKNINGISYKRENKIIHNPRRNLIENLDQLAFPDRTDTSLYLEHRYLEKQIIPIMATRGCPYQCIFCSKEICGTQLRYRSPENVVKEMNIITSKYKNIVFQFRDDIFTFNSTWTIKLCELIIKNKLNYEWLCNTRADCISEDLLKLMVQAGCKRISLGAETGDDLLLHVLNKKLTVKQILNSSKLIHEAGLKLKYYLIVGIPGQTAESIQKTIRLIKIGRPDEIYCSVFTPMIGTKAWDNKEKLGIRLLFDPNNIQDWEKVYYQSNLNYEEAKPPIETQELTSNEIIHLRKKIFETFNQLK